MSDVDAGCSTASERARRRSSIARLRADAPLPTVITILRNVCAHGVMPIVFQPPTFYQCSAASWRAAIDIFTPASGRLFSLQLLSRDFFFTP